MKHIIKTYKFGSSRSERDAIIRNLAIDLIKNNHVTTTAAKAKAVRPFIERIFSRSKKGDMKRYVGKLLGCNNLYTRIEEISKKYFPKINSGFVNIYKLGFRKGDNAEMVKVILTGYEPPKKSKLKKVGKKTQDTKPLKEEKKESGFEKLKGIIKRKNSSKSSQVKTGDSDTKARSRSGI